MVQFTEFNRSKFYRPMYGQYKGWYFPYGRYSDLRIGDIREQQNLVGNGYNSYVENFATLLGHHWEDIEDEKKYSPYKEKLVTLHTYDSDNDSKSYGHGIVLRVFNLDQEIAEVHGDEKLAYQNIINTFVSDSSFYRSCDTFAPYSAIETSTYAENSIGDDSPTLFKKHITIFANKRAYKFLFYVDQEVKRPFNINTFDFLDSEFVEIAEKLDLHSYTEWQEQESDYLNNLNIKCCIYIALYLLCIIGAISFAYRYFKNIGNVNVKAALTTRILSYINFAVFGIVGLCFIIAFCSIKEEFIHDIYRYRFSAFIDDDAAASSVLCYGAAFILLIIPTNIFYIKSYTQPKPKDRLTKTNHSVLYWVVRPFVLVSKFFSKSTKAIRDEYNKQISDK